MKYGIHPWHLVVSWLAALVNEEQSKIIDYLLVENQVLRERIGNRRIRFTDNQRRRLAVKAKALGRKALGEFGPIVTPDTLLRWHRRLVARKYDGSPRRTAGRPKTKAEIEKLILRMARENPRWGYTRIQGALANLGHVIGRMTFARTLEEHGVEPAPCRRKTMSWGAFLKAHWDVMAATDLFTVEVWIRGNLIRYHVLFALELATRRVEVLGITPNPDGAWIEQVGRNATDGLSGFLLGKEYLIADRDPLFTQAFRRMMKASGVEVLRLPPRSPNLNAYAERFVRSIKEECLGQMIFFSEEQLRTAVGEYVEHYHMERNHQGLDNQLIEPAASPGNPGSRVICDQRLGGLLSHYRRAA